MTASVKGSARPHRLEHSRTSTLPPPPHPPSRPSRPPPPPPHFYFITSLIPSGKFSSLSLGKAQQQSQEQRHPFLLLCQCPLYFRVSKQWYSNQCLGFLTCVQMLVHTIARRGCLKGLERQFWGTKSLQVVSKQLPTCLKLCQGFD